MSGSRTTGFTIGVGLDDSGAVAKIDAWSKRLHALSAPAERFNKSMAKFGEVSGITRVGEGIKGLGDNALETARAIERLVTPMGLLTSAASVAGIAEMARRWGDAGTQIGKISYQLSVPVTQLSKLGIAANLAGSSAEAMTSSMKGLSDTVNAAYWRRDSNAIMTLNTMGIAFEEADAAGNKHARPLLDVLNDVQRAVQSLDSPKAKVHLLEQLGMSPDLLPLFDKAAGGLRHFTEQAEQTGAVMTTEMAQNADELHKSFERIGANIMGIGNRLLEKWTPPIKNAIEWTSKWIEANNKSADSIAEIGASVMAFGALKPAGWILRLLGLGAVSAAGAAAATAVAAEELFYRGTRAKDTQTQDDENKALGGSMSERFPGLIVGRTADKGFWDRYNDSFGPGAWRGGRGPRLPGPRANPSRLTAGEKIVRAQEAHDYFVSTGRYSEANIAGMVGEMQFESGFDPRARNPVSGMPGIYQWDTHRRGVFRSLFGHDIDDPGIGDDQLFREQLRFSDYEMQHEERGAYDALRRETTAGGSAASINRNYLRSGDYGRGDEALGEQYVRSFQSGAAGPPSTVDGKVDVNIHLHNAPPGTTATATASGAAHAAPPRIVTSMPDAR